MFRDQELLYFTPAADTQTQSSAQTSIRDSASPGSNVQLTCVFWITLPVGWAVFWWLGRAQRRGLASHPQRRDLGEVCVCGSDWERAVMSCVGVHVKLCPRQDTGPVLWGAAQDAQLSRRWSSFGGSRRNTCLTLAVCPLPGTACSQPVPPLRAGPLTPQREDPQRVLWGHGHRAGVVRVGSR